MPPSIRVEFGGGYQEQQRSFKDLAFVLILAIVLVFMVLLFEFANFAAAVAGTEQPCGDIEDALALHRLMDQAYGRETA